MIEKKFIKNNSVYFSSMVIGGILGYLFNFILARNLSVDQFGEFQGIISVMAIVGIFSSAFSYFAIKYSSVFSLHQDNEGQINFIVFLKEKFRLPVLISFAIFIFLMPFIKKFLNLNDYGGLLIIGMTMLVSFYASFYLNSIQGWSNFTFLSYIGIISVLIKVTSGYLSTVFYPSSSSAMVSFFIPAIASWIIAKRYVGKKWGDSKKTKGNKNENTWKEKYFSGLSFKKSFIKILFFSAGITVLGSADIILLRNIADAQIAGYYSALSVLGKAIFSLNLAFIVVLFPEACSQGYLSQPAKTKSVLGSYALIAAISLPSILIFYLFPELIVNSLFGEKYAEVASNLWIFGVMGLAFSLITLESKLALARHDFKSTIILFFATLIFSYGIYFFQNNLKAIIISVIAAMMVGWIGVLSLNLIHRYRYRQQKLISS